jgi:hypothetical protein
MSEMSEENNGGSIFSYALSVGRKFKFAIGQLEGWIRTAKKTY